MEKNQKKGISQRWDELQPSKTMLVWACVGCIAATMVVGFTWGGWVTGGTARGMAGTAGDEARGELASVVCVENFMAAPDAAAQLVALKEISSSYQQRQFVEKGGWAVMPGKDSPDRRAVDLCTKVLANWEVPETAEMAPAVVQPASVQPKAAQ
jgi:hypothetical protein